MSRNIKKVAPSIERATSSFEIEARRIITKLNETVEATQTSVSTVSYAQIFMFMS